MSRRDAAPCSMGACVAPFRRRAAAGARELTRLVERIIDVAPQVDVEVCPAATGQYLWLGVGSRSPYITCLRR
jgi:hypothetical protein